MNKSTITAEKLADLLAKARLARGLSTPISVEVPPSIPENFTLENSVPVESELVEHTVILNTTSALNTLNTLTNNNTLQGVDKTGKVIDYNEAQLAFMKLAGTGTSAILIGAAGTGKTTCMRGAVTSLIDTGIAGVLAGEDHKYLPPKGSPGIVAVSFTRRAVANLRKAM